MLKNAKKELEFGDEGGEGGEGEWSSDDDRDHGDHDHVVGSQSQSGDSIENLELGDTSLRKDEAKSLRKRLRKRLRVVSERTTEEREGGDNDEKDRQEQGNVDESSLKRVNSQSHSRSQSTDGLVDLNRRRIEEEIDLELDMGTEAFKAISFSFCDEDDDEGTQHRIDALRRHNKALRERIEQAKRTIELIKSETQLTKSQLTDSVQDLKKKNVVLRVCLSEEKEKHARLLRIVRGEEDASGRKKSMIRRWRKASPGEAFAMRFLVAFEQIQAEKLELATRVTLLEERIRLMQASRPPELGHMRSLLIRRSQAIDVLRREISSLQRSVRKLRGHIRGGDSAAAAILQQDDGLSPRPDWVELITRRDAISAAIDAAEQKVPDPIATRISPLNLVAMKSTQRAAESLLLSHARLEKKIQKLKTRLAFSRQTVLQKSDPDVRNQDHLTRKKWLWFDSANFSGDREGISEFFSSLQPGRVFNGRLGRLATADIVNLFWVLKEIDREMAPDAFLLLFLRKDDILDSCPTLLSRVLTLRDACCRFSDDLVLRLFFEIVFGHADEKIYWRLRSETDNVKKMIMTFLPPGDDSESVRKDLLLPVLRNALARRLPSCVKHLETEIENSHLGETLMNIDELFHPSSDFTRIFLCQLIIERNAFLVSVEDALYELLEDVPEDSLALHQFREVLESVDSNRPRNQVLSILQETFRLESELEVKEELEEPSGMMLSVAVFMERLRRTCVFMSE